MFQEVISHYNQKYFFQLYSVMLFTYFQNNNKITACIPLLNKEYLHDNQSLEYI